MIIDYRLRNLAITRTRGIDLKFSYQLETKRGSFDFALMGNYMFDFRPGVHENGAGDR